MNSKKKIKINFSDFWHGKSHEDIKERNPLYHLLSKRFELQICDDPDFLVYSSGVFGKDFFNYRCTRIFYTGENDRPDFTECDYAFTFDYIENPRHYRLPLYKFYLDLNILTKPRNIDQIMEDKTEFCAFLVSNPDAKKRIDFFKRLSFYKKVASGGRVLNNIGYRVKNRDEFIKKAKFCIAFENSSYPGYTTEKIILPWLMGCIPIYWGSPLIAREFNAKAFVNCHDFDSLDQVIDHIKKIDQSEEIYREYLNQPLFIGNKVPNYLMDESILDKFEDIFSSSSLSKPIGLTLTSIIKGYYHIGKKPFQKIKLKLANTFFSK